MSCATGNVWEPSQTSLVKLPHRNITSTTSTTLDGRKPIPFLLPLRLFPKPQTGCCVLRYLVTSKVFVSNCLRAPLTGCALPGLRSLCWGSRSFYLTYKSAAEHEAKTHSKRMQLPSGLQSNVGKTPFWQDSHLLPREESSLEVCFL